MTMMHAVLPMTLATAIAMTSATLCAEGPSFAVTTSVFQGASLDAADEHRIVFDQGLTYDLPKIEPRYVTLYDPAQGRVTLLDRHTHVQATISTADLLKITAQARAASSSQQQEQLGLTATVQPSTRVIGYSMKFGIFEYHTATQTPKHPAMAMDYGRFADLAARLNLVRRLGPPPFGRMTLNQHMAAAGVLPLETTLTLHRGEQPEEIRITHQVDELGEQDRQAIDEVRGMLALYKDVPMSEFP